MLQKKVVENTSENPITEESCTDKFPKRVDGITDDRIEALGEINKSSQLYGSDASTCYVIEGSSTEARAHTVEEQGKLAFYQCAISDHDKESKYTASNEILSFSELNQHNGISLVPEVHDHESESYFSSLDIETQSHHSLSEIDCEGEKEASENDLKNAIEKSSAGVKTESPGSSEDNCARGKKEFENELKNNSEFFFTDNEDLEEVHAGGDSSADGRREWIGNLNPISCHEIADLSIESIKPSEADQFQISFNQSGTEARYKSGDDEKSGDASISNKVLSSPKLKHLENASKVPEYNIYRSGKSSLLSSPKQVAGSGCSSPENDNEGNNQHSSQVEEVDENMENLSILTSTNAETLLDSVTNDQIFTANSFSSEGISLDNLLSPRREMQQVESDMVPGFWRVGSDDTLDNTSHFYAKGDLGITLRSPTSRNYYAYDDSASSNETENEVPDRRLQLLKRSLKDVNSDSTKVFPERGKFIRNHVTSNESELQHQLMNFESSLHGKKHFTKNVSRWPHDELLQCTRYRSPVRNRMMNETDYYNSRPLFSKYSSQAEQGNTSSSNYGQNEFSALPDNPHDLHRLELLRMVYELQDQLKKTQISEVMPRERFLSRPSKGKGHHFAESRENYTDLAYNDYHERRAVTWMKHRELPQMIVPEDPTHYMHRVDCSCFCCCNQEQHHSAQIPSNAIYYSEQRPLSNARQTSRPHHSASSSLHHYATSEFSLWSQDMEPDNKKHKEARIHHIAKRHFQPIAGGAPIIACYHCSETLQVPAESFLFRRRCHQLKCGACSEVLKFSLENKVHVVRYDLIPRNPPPNKIAENTRTIKKSNLAIAHRENDRPLAEPETSTNNSQSFSRSYSTGDNFSATPGKSSSANSSTAPKESIRSRSTRRSVYRIKSAAESFKSARSTMPDPENSESEVESPLPGSALHKLMGYSSIRRLVFQ
ncbi:hypothetical protein AgCh_006410 [Apium graveolens]